MSPKIEKHGDTRAENAAPAPGRPGERPSWSTGAKTAVGTALSGQSRVWFTIAHGYLNEIYFPDVDRANTRTLRFLVAGDDFFSDEATGTNYTIRTAAPGIPIVKVASECKQKRYRLEKEFVADPDRDALLVRVRFEPFDTGLRLYVFCNPHLGDEGEDNNAWTGHYKGIPMLFAQREGTALAVACSTKFSALSCGFVGVSDPWTDICSNRRLTQLYTEASRGNIGLGAEIDWKADGGEFTLACAFGGGPSEAGLQARAALRRSFSEVRSQYLEDWSSFHESISSPASSEHDNLFRVSAAVSRIHESKRFPGAFIASLSIPWGFDRGDKDTGGYHVIWPRDLCESALGLLACGDSDSARRAIFYLSCTQEADGHWHQNMWLDGTEHWTSKQMDETAFPILLADSLRRLDELRGFDPWPMVKKAAAYLVAHGPVAQEDRWEAVAGYATFTMAVEIAALLAAADFAEEKGETDLAKFMRETSDAWNEAVDELTYAKGTELARKHGLDGYYVRVTPPDAIRDLPLESLTIKLTNHPKGKETRRAVDVVSPDALALVRYGLRSAEDPRIQQTVQVIDATLKKMTSTGPVWRRFTEDGYGEHEDGSPFKKTGIGRGWPLLAGERAHYEIAKGDLKSAEDLRKAIAAQTSECGLIPEQIWDAPDIPERGLYNGRPSGSGMPLVWAHAEYIQLLCSLQDGKIWSLPPQTVARYIASKHPSPFQIWTPEQKRERLNAGKNLRLDLPVAGKVQWTVDCWQTLMEQEAQDSGLGIHCALLNVSDAAKGLRISFRVNEGEAHQVTVV